jgi:hypothetical protein
MSYTPVDKWKPPELIYGVGRYFGSLAKIGELADRHQGMKVHIQRDQYAALLAGCFQNSFILCPGQSDLSGVDSIQPLFS